MGAWYLMAGLVALAMAGETHALSPWSMGLPFLVGQAWLAAIVHRSAGGSDGEL